MRAWRPAYVGVGSNLGDSRSLLVRAVERLAATLNCAAVQQAQHYRSPPLGTVVQPDFVNTAAGFLTTLTAHELLAATRAIEIALGREPQRTKWGPRLIDLDLLVLGGECISDSELTLPHPGIAERSFVLYPLADIAPTLEIPGLGRVADLQQRVAPNGIERLA